MSHALQSQITTQDMNTQKENSPIIVEEQPYIPHHLPPPAVINLEKFKHKKETKPKIREILADSNSFHENSPLRTSTQMNSIPNNREFKTPNSINQNINGSKGIAKKLANIKVSTPLTASAGQKRKSNEDASDTDSLDLAAKKSFFSLEKKSRATKPKKEIVYIDEDPVEATEIICLSGEEKESKRKSLLNYEKLRKNGECGEDNQWEQQTVIDTSIEERFEDFMKDAKVAAKDEEDKLTVREEKQEFNVTIIPSSPPK